MADNQLGRARDILHGLEARKSLPGKTSRQVQFLLGLIDVADRDYASAIARFHRILVFEPRAVRVRLELARAYLLSKDYANAERQFLLARAARGLPRSVRDNIDRYLASLRFRRTFSWNVALSVAADSNMNAGPAADSISLYGVPFQLSPDAKANAGVGFAFDGAAEWAPRMGGPWQWRLGAQLHRSQYLRTEFDDMTASVYTGPRLTLARWTVDLSANVARRWFGDRPYLDSAGGGLSATYYLRPNLGLGLGTGFDRLGYAQTPLQTGPGGNLFSTLFYTPTSTSIVRASASIGLQQAQIPAYASHIQQYGVSYTREFEGGLTLGLAPTFTRMTYEAPLAAFAARRVDDLTAIQTTVLDRRIDWDGFTPRVVYTYTIDRSSIPLYRFHRSLVQLGVTRAF